MMTKYQTIREKTLEHIRTFPGMKSFIFSNSTIPNGTMSVEVETKTELDSLGELLSSLDVGHMPSEVTISPVFHFSMYFREEDLVFAVMEKDEKDIENAENEFLKNTKDIEEATKRFISYNDFIKWYFMVWLPE